MNKLIESKLRKMVQKEIKSVLKEDDEVVKSILDYKNQLEKSYPEAWTLYNTMLSIPGFKRIMDRLKKLEDGNDLDDKTYVLTTFEHIQRQLSQFIQIHCK